MTMHSVSIDELPVLFNRTKPLITLPKLTVKDGSLTSIKEYEAVAMLTQLQQPKKVFEIGTFEGVTAWVLALNAPRAQVYTLNLPPGNKPSTRYQLGKLNERYVKDKGKLAFDDTKEAKRITQVFGDSARFDFGPFKSHIDFFFVDGAHTYAYTKNDSQKAFETVSKDGLILWHDYNPSYWKGTVKCLDELAQKHDLYHIKDTCLVFWKKF